MKTQPDIKNDILVQLGVSTTVVFFTDAILDDWIDKAHKWGAGYRKWPFTEGKVTTTYVADSDPEAGFLYPEGWKPDSIRMLQVGGKRFQKLNFYKYQEFREDQADDKKKVFSDHGLSYFINPKADVSGTTTLWGQYTPATIDDTDNTATTVFSGYAEEGNEAIVQEVISYAKAKEQKLQEALAWHEQAKKTLEELWTRITDEQFGYQGGDDAGMFKRIDVLSGAMRDDMFKRDQFY